MSNLSIYEKVFAENGMMWMDITASNIRIALNYEVEYQGLSSSQWIKHQLDFLDPYFLEFNCVVWSALPTERTSQLGAGHHVGSK